MSKTIANKFWQFGAEKLAQDWYRKMNHLKKINMSATKKERETQMAKERRAIQVIEN
jgi:tRNA A22 N-methylase